MLFPASLARVLTDQPEVVAAAVPLIRIAAMFQLFDGMQVVFAYAPARLINSASAKGFR